MIEKRWLFGSFVAGALSSLGAAMALVLTGMVMDKQRQKAKDRRKAVQYTGLRPVQ